MKKIIFIIALAISFGLKAQTIYSPSTQTVYGKNENRVRATIAMLIPTGCGTPTALSSVSVISNQSAIYFDSCNKFLFTWSPSNSAWERVNSDTTETRFVRLQNSYPTYRQVGAVFISGHYKGDSTVSSSSAGYGFYTNGLMKAFSYGAGGSTEVTFNGFAGMDFNRSGSMTSTSFTPKVYVDSLAALRLLKADSLSGGYTSWLLTKKKVDSLGAVKLGVADSSTYFYNVVRTFGTQTIGGNKTFSNDITVNSMRVGLGGGSQPQNVALGLTALNSNTTGAFNTSIGFQSLFDNTTATNNTAVGSQSLANLTTGSNNIGIGVGAGTISGGAVDLTTIANSIFLGSNTKASANGNTNEIVIGDNTTGNGSNTVTIGNSSITNNYFNGTISGTSISMSGRGTFGGASTNGVLVSESASAVTIPTNGLSLNTGFNVSYINSYKGGVLVDLYYGASNHHFDNPVLIAGATTDGTNKIIVNGGVKGNTATIGNTAGTPFEIVTSASSVFMGMKDNSGVYAYIGSSNGEFKVQTAGSGFSDKLVISTSGEATFSSSIQLGTTAYNNYLLSNVTAASGYNQTFQFRPVTVPGSGSAKTLSHFASVSAGGTTQHDVLVDGILTVGSSVTATGFIVSSDLRYKDIISQDGDLYQYTLKADPTKQIHYGYIAQEVEKTLPFAVTTNENGYKAVNYTEVHAIKIRELEKRIEQLEKLLNK